MSGLLPHLGVVLLYLLLFLLLLVLTRVALRVTVGRDMVARLAEADSPAAGTLYAGQVLAVAVVFLGAYLGPSRGLLTDLGLVFGYGVLGILFVLGAQALMARGLFRQLFREKRLLADDNVSLALVRASLSVATGLIAAASVHGEQGGVPSALVSFVLGQAFLLGFSYLYDHMTGFDLLTEVSHDNRAAAFAFAGTLLAYGILIAAAASGAVGGPGEQLARFLAVAVVGAAVLTGVRLGVDRLVLPGHDLNLEITRDRNVAAGIVEMATAVAVAVVLAALV